MDVILDEIYWHRLVALVFTSLTSLVVKCDIMGLLLLLLRHIPFTKLAKLLRSSK